MSTCYRVVKDGKELWRGTIKNWYELHHNERTKIVSETRDQSGCWQHGSDVFKKMEQLPTFARSHMTIEELEANAIFFSNSTPTQER